MPEFCVSIGFAEKGKPVAGGIYNPATLILAGRSEVKRGEWKQFEYGLFKVQAMGSVALVSAGLADITFTLTPKNEWDVVAGAALVKSAGGFVSTLEKTNLTANRRDPLLSGLLASGPFLKDKLMTLVELHLRAVRADTLSLTSSKAVTQGKPSVRPDSQPKLRTPRQHRLREAGVGILVLFSWMIGSSSSNFFSSAAKGLIEWLFTDKRGPGTTREAPQQDPKRGGRASELHETRTHC